MKKFLMVALMLVSLTNVFAYGVTVIDKKEVITYNKVRTFDFSINNSKLSKYLDMYWEQKERVDDIHDEFCEKMKKASKITDINKQDEEIKKCINFELANMKAVLSDEQYRKFLRVFNATLINHGFAETLMRIHEKKS